MATGHWKSQFSFQSPRKAMPKKAQTTAQLHSSHMLVREGNGTPLQCFCLENPRDREAWWAAVYGVAQSRTQLKRLSSSKMSPIVQQFEHSLALPFFVPGMKTDLSQTYGHCRVFQIFWYIECSTFTASSSGFEIAQLEFHHLHQLGLQWCFLRPT